MTVRERFFDAISGEKCDYVPFDLTLCPALQEELRRKTGTKDYLAFFNAPIRCVYPKYNGNTDRFKHYFEDTEDISISAWGIGYKKTGIAHFTEKLSPMLSFDSLDQFEAYPYPKLEEYDGQYIKDACDEIRKNDLIINARLTQTMFEKAWQMRGMEPFLVDLIDDREMAECLIDHIFRVQVGIAKSMSQAGCDILSLGDDVATQRGMMISVETWREVLKPRLSMIIQESKKIKKDLLVFYHSCGNVEAILDDLVEIGINIINPVQPECMDVFSVYRRYGGKLVIWGGLGTQKVLPFTSAENVRAECERMLSAFGPQGHFILAPAHVVEPEVPLDNVFAFVNAVRQYNEGKRCLN